MLFGLGGLSWTTLPRESHVPTFILGILESRIVIFQNNLSEDAVFASTLPLANELSSLVHAYVVSCLCPFNANTTSKRVCFHFQLSVHGSVLPVGVDSLIGQDLDVFPARAAVQLVSPGQSAAHPVRQPALLGDMVLEIRRGLYRVLCVKAKRRELE